MSKFVAADVSRRTSKSSKSFPPTYVGGYITRYLSHILIVAFAFCALFASAQTNNPPLQIPNWVAAETNIAYDKYDATKLDVMWPKAATNGLRPGVVMFHGGGWIRSSKETMMGSFCTPYLRQGFVVCNVEYRLAPAAKAPAAVEDALHAANWFFAHASQYKVDSNRMVVTGASAGGHLALMVGMTPASAGFGAPEKFAAIVNGYGITDVADVLEGPHRQAWAGQWLPEQDGRAELAKKLSPLTYARKYLPPILTVHGADDHTVPVAQAERLTEALKAAGADAELFVVPGAQHGFTREQWPAVHERIWEFLKKHGVLRGE